jgi:hypothetical protein
MLSAVVLTACDGSGKRDVRDSVAAIEAAINDADYGVLLDDFSAADCKQSFSRDAFVADFQRDPFQVIDVNLLDQNIVIDHDTAYIILTETFQLADGSRDTQTFQSTLAKEDGRWRDSECFEGLLGGPTRSD